MTTEDHKLSHFDQQGQAHMVDVGGKEESRRRAVARGSIRLATAAFQAVTGTGTTAPKGDVLGVARIAAIQGAKQTSALIPLCHPLPLTHVAVSFHLDDAEQRVVIEVCAETVGRTGVEMEALTGASVGLLTLYDMLKALDKGMVIEAVELVRKEGGKSGMWERGEPPADPTRRDDDTPEWDAEDFKSAKRLSEMPADFQQAIRRARGPQKAPRKVQTAVRYDVDIIEAFTADGPGWQTRMNDALRDWLRSHHRV